MSDQSRRQEQFLNVLTRDEAAARFHAHLPMTPLGSETVPLAAALQRVLAADVVASVDVPAFDRSNVDGFAIRAADTFGAAEHDPKFVELNHETLHPGVVPTQTVQPGTATAIATGGVLPRGADAVVMIEHTDLADPNANRLAVRRAVSPGDHVTFAGTDIARGETVLRRGTLITSREIGVLAAIGLAQVGVLKRPRVAVISTGDELIPPGDAPAPAAVYDSNAAILASALTELGCEPIAMGIVADQQQALESIFEKALECDAVILSGGTSKGAGDISYRLLERLTDPGIVAHGVALKPGKPICLAVTQGKPVVVLPGFPTSAIFTFHELVAPALRAMAGLSPQSRETVTARVPMRIPSDPGRTEFVLVRLVEADRGLTAYPIGKGSGSVTTFSHADGFLTIERQCEFLGRDQPVEVQLLGRHIEPADLVVIGSHCTGLDDLLGELQDAGFTAKALFVGSQAGLEAAKRRECDIAGIHLLDEATLTYNRPFLDDSLELIEGYGRRQGIVYRPGDQRFEGRTPEDAIAQALRDPECTMINRNRGSGTRILIDRLLAGEKPPGYVVQAKSHNAVAAAVAQGRADWGLAIDVVARGLDLAFIPYQNEQYDFAAPKSRLNRPTVTAFRNLLTNPRVRQKLKEKGFYPPQKQPPSE